MTPYFEPILADLLLLYAAVDSVRSWTLVGLKLVHALGFAWPVLVR